MVEKIRIFKNKRSERSEKAVSCSSERETSAYIWRQNRHVFSSGFAAETTYTYWTTELHNDQLHLKGNGNFSLQKKNDCGGMAF